MPAAEKTGTSFVKYSTAEYNAKGAACQITPLMLEGEVSSVHLLQVGYNTTGATEQGQLWL